MKLIDTYKLLFPKDKIEIPVEYVRFKPEKKSNFGESVKANKQRILNFVAWVDHLEKNKRTNCNHVRSGFAKLIKNSKEPPFNGNELICNALKSCWCAKQYDLEGSPYQHNREMQKQAIDSIDDLLHEKIRKLPFILKNRPFLDDAMWIATQVAERNGVVIDSELGSLKQWQVILEAFIEGLEVYEQSYPFGKEANHRIGCLYYPKGIQFGGAKPEAGTMLAFDLTRQFRLYSAKKSDRDCLDYISKSEMHSIGKPSYELVANLVNLALDKRWSSGSARDLVNQLIDSNNGLRFKDWPHG